MKPFVVGQTLLLAEAPTTVPQRFLLNEEASRTPVEGHGNMCWAAAEPHSADRRIRAAECMSIVFVAHPGLRPGESALCVNRPEGTRPMYVAISIDDAFRLVNSDASEIDWRPTNTVPEDHM